MMKYLVLSTSLNPESKSLLMAQSAFKHLKKVESKTEFIDVTKIKLPFCDGDSCYENKEVLSISKKIKEADGILIASPVYNYDLNAFAKNLMELTGRAWSNKVVGILCAAGGQSSYMSVLGFANSLMIDFRCIIIPRFVYANKNAFLDDKIVDKEINERIVELTKELHRISSALK